MICTHEMLRFIVTPGTLELDVNLKMDMSVMNQPTPAPQPTRATAAKKSEVQRFVW